MLEKSDQDLLEHTHGVPLAEVPPFAVWGDHFAYNGEMYPIQGASASFASWTDNHGPFHRTKDSRGMIVVTCFRFDGKPHEVRGWVTPPYVQAREIVELINRLSAAT